MRAFRLLLWLRWRLAINLTTGRQRWASIALSALLVLAFSPFYLGSAVLSYGMAARDGASALLVVFGGAQFAIVWVSLLAGALGRTFELDKLKRYPFRPRDVYAFNVIASLGEPIVLMTLPSLVAVVLGVSRHDGTAAGFAAAGGALVLLLITAALLQLLLAILDDFLRREWMRYVAGLFLTGTIIAVQLVVGGTSRRIAEQSAKAGFTPERMLEEFRSLFEKVPTAAAPASLGGAHVSWPLGHPLVALLACAMLLGLPLWLGSRVMSRAVLRETLAGRVRTRAVRAGAGAFATRWPGLTPAQAVLMAREWLYLVRSPAVLYQMVITPLVLIFLTLIGRTRDAGRETFLWMFLLTTGLASRNLMLWAFDGPGVRTLFLMPFAPRDLVLSKNVAWLASTFAHVTITLAVLAVLRPARLSNDLPLMLVGFIAVAFTAASIGTWVSITQPVKPQGRGFTRQSPGGLAGFVAYLVVLALVGLVVLAVMAARALSPDAYDVPVTWLLLAVVLCVSAGVWWISLDRHAEEMVRQRERMIDVLAKGTDR